MNRKGFLNRTLFAFIGIPFAANAKLQPETTQAWDEIGLRGKEFIFNYKALYEKLSQYHLDRGDIMNLTLLDSKICIQMNEKEFNRFRDQFKRKAAGEEVDMREWETKVRAQYARVMSKLI